MYSSKGMMYPEIKAGLGGTPMQSAMLELNNNAKLQATANSLIGGRIKRRHRRGGGAITVPQFPNSNSSSANINNTIAQLARTSTQMDAYSIYDNLSRQMGGGTRRKRGGNINWVWGCMSGGRKRKSRGKKSKSRKSRRKH